MNAGRPLSLKLALCHDCRPSVRPSVCLSSVTDVLLLNGAIGPRLLLITNRKSHTGFQITYKSMILKSHKLIMHYGVECFKL